MQVYLPYPLFVLAVSLIGFGLVGILNLYQMVRHINDIKRLG